MKCFLWGALGLLTVFVSLAEPFKEEKQPELGIVAGFKGSELCIVAENTQRYISENLQDEFAVHAGKIIDEQFTLEKVQNTLKFLCKTYHEDVRAKRPSRLHDADFLRENLRFYRWTPDKNTAHLIAQKSTNEVKTRLLANIPSDQIFLTKYYTKLLNGSAARTSFYTQALYGLPYDEKGKTIAEAYLQKDVLTRFKYTRQEVISGVLLENDLAKPLVWISEAALHDVLLQGTGVLNVNGNIRYFNVHRNNGIAYNYAIGKSEQARYWYFAEVPSIMGYGNEIEDKIAIRPQVTFAGNVSDLGLGKLIMVNYAVQNESTGKSQNISRMGVLADQGGAFDNNLFQLDLLVDSYQGWSDYYQANKHMPDYANAWILLLK